MPSLGLELEMVPIDADSGALHAVGPVYFATLAERHRSRGEAVSEKRLDGRVVGLSGAWGTSGIDNGFALLETAFAPNMDGTLAPLAAAVERELTDISAALAAEGACLANLSQHPDAPCDREAWQRLRASRRIYDFLVGYRGWNHAVGFDAKAQNGPTTGLEPGHAIEALTLMQRAAPAFIALFANSPLESGQRTGLKETRMTLWPRMVAASRFPTDGTRVGVPDRPFADMADYMRWTFGKGTAMQAIPLDHGGYKDGDGLGRVVGDPSLLDFLTPGAGHGADAMAVPVPPLGQEDGPAVPVTPSLAHLEALQWSNFLDMRLRFTLADPLPPPEVFVKALTTSGGVEAFFDRYATALWLENRVPGTTLADRVLARLDNGDVARSQPLGPSALQAGLLRDRTRAAGVLEELVPWQALPGLRRAAIRHGLTDSTVARLARAVADCAAAALAPEEQWMLAGVQHGLRTRTTAADRLLVAWEGKDVLGNPFALARGRAIPLGSRL